MCLGCLESGSNFFFRPLVIDIFETLELRIETFWVHRVSQGYSEFDSKKILFTVVGSRYDFR